jgi:aspartyl-tRNA(Asn)/glutamyl-tRNA(Gln) amidotransferase subunit C
MALTRDEVLHIARLARLALAESDVDRMRNQISDILGHFEALQSVPTDGIEPTAYPLPLNNVMRADETTPSLRRDEALANVPEADDGYLRVRAVLE